MKIDVQSGRPTREAYGEAILELGRENKDIYVIDADVGKSCHTIPFSKELPAQYVNVGIAEAACLGVAAGLATCGKVPFVTTYAVFGSMRMLEQIRQEVCYPKLNVKIACSHGGLTPANDGASHQGIEDMGIFRTIPNMTVVMGADFTSTKKLLREIASMKGPCYIRFTRDKTPDIYDEHAEFVIGKANTLIDGSDVTIIANGDTLGRACVAAEELIEEGISVRLIDMHTIKPLDKAIVVKALAETAGIVTVEDHNIINGLGSAVCEVAAEIGGKRVLRLGIQDQFGESAPYQHLLDKNGITVDNIKNCCKTLLQ